MKIDERVTADLEEFYTKATLHKGFFPFVKQLFSPLLMPPDIELPPDLREILEKKALSKHDMMALVGVVLSSQELFERMFALMPEELRSFFEKMIWVEGFLHEGLVQEQYGIELVNELKAGYGRPREVKPHFQVFAVRAKHDWNRGNIFFITLPPGISQVVANYFPKPEGYYLKAIQQLPEGFLRFSGEKSIFQELPRLLAYGSQDNIKLSVSGLPMASTLNKMRKTLALQEFYEGQPKPYNTLRSSLLATLISDYGVYTVDADPLETLQKLFDFFKTSFYPLNLLTHLKGLNKIGDNFKFPVGAALMEILADLPQEEGENDEKAWVSLPNIQKYASYRSLPLHPAVDFVFSNYLYVPVKEYGYTERVPAYHFYHELVKNPMISGAFWLFAAFGLVEIAYIEPDEQAEDEFPDDEVDLSTPYDPLFYVRLTPLGAYLTGKAQKYKPLQTAERTAIQLLDDSLHILSEKPDETHDLLLGNYTVKTAPSRYRTDFKIFMKGVKNGDELEDKIGMFQQTVSKELPPNWKAFFETLRLKCDPLQSIGEHNAYQLSQQDQELINLVARDPVLKKLAIKAEGLIILVMKKDTAKFKSRLKEFGYLLE